MVTETRKILGQLNAPSAGWNLIYTVPVGKEAVISTIFAVNITEDDEIKYSIAATPAGVPEPLDDHFIYSELPLTAHDTFKVTPGITLSEGDKVYGDPSAAGAVTFSAFGVEITP